MSQIINSPEGKNLLQAKTLKKKRKEKKDSLVALRIELTSYLFSLGYPLLFPKTISKEKHGKISACILLYYPNFRSIHVCICKHEIRLVSDIILL